MSLESTDTDNRPTLAYVASETGRGVMRPWHVLDREAALPATRLALDQDELVTDGDAGWPELIPLIRRRAEQKLMKVAQARSIIELWTLAHTRVPTVRKPGAGPSDDGTYYLAWSFSDVDTVVTVEISPAGQCEWFIARGEHSSSGEGTSSKAIDAIAADLPTNAP